jgi:hypothetical protein
MFDLGAYCIISKPYANIFGKKKKREEEKLCLQRPHSSGYKTQGQRVPSDWSNLVNMFHLDFVLPAWAPELSKQNA